MRDSFLGLITPSGGAAPTFSVSYMPGERGTLDIYAPKDAKNAPVVVFFYGGSWQMGRKSLYRFVGHALAKRGVVAVIPDYRVYPEVRFPDFLKDGAKAFKWTHDNAASFGGDANRIFVMGHSAGAHIAAMLALDPQWLKGEGLDPARSIAGFVGLSGPYDFLPLQSENLVAVFKGNNRPETQPINFATASAPPAFLATGDEDDVVLPRNSQNLAARLRGAGASVEQVVYPGRGHFGTIMAMIGPLHYLAPVVDDVAGFINSRGAR
ncbi:esterase [Terrihabitans soli]|uniref:Esterase n=1 Tax=Terrihabitans soli TaxID=708113 RepID=A0A6S6QH27_9HYPH|nr:alpha/beta hydrolase [Terrihabitans soli]BCJ90463.1 esterase [Terrihabitans soli]